MVHQIESLGEQVILGTNGALVASKSQPGVWYVVRLGACQCKGFTYRGHCRHVEAIKAWHRAHQSAEEWYRDNVAALRGAV